MEPKLTKQSEAILAKLKIDVAIHFLTEEELAQVRKGLALAESMGVMGRFVITVAALVGAITTIFNFWPGGGK